MRKVFQNNVGLSYPDTDTHKPMIINAEENIISGLPYNNIFTGKTRIAQGTEKNNVNIYNLVKTQKGERLFLPDFGVDFNNFLFEPNDFIFADMIKLEIRQAVSIWLPNINITDIEVKPNRKEAVVVIYYTSKEDPKGTAFEFGVSRNI